ncbi:hypothetical protein P154DRAFT_562484 [Amniculicola lignicola CBS 123094]|uniref:Uncharacterized protein n=1 Tax=Amniculicola lignicola CBS 123094 TaxID=1392246 RepID=A0A6A5WLB5_9PLEO|nr:hypothetical protein P154DRAFT_562484 [Amniculicola lignicola CBS 123094]
MPRLLDLPSELFSLIIKEHVDEVGIVEAWHSRIVCKIFKAYLSDEIFKNQPLQKFDREHDNRMQTSNILVKHLQTFFDHRMNWLDGSLPTCSTFQNNTAQTRRRIQLPRELYELDPEHRAQYMQDVISATFFTTRFTNVMWAYGSRAFDRYAFQHGPEHKQGLIMAAAAGDIRLAQKFLDEGATPYDFLLHGLCFSTISDKNMLLPPLVAASINGKTEMVRLLVDHINRNTTTLATRVVIQAALKEAIEEALRNGHSGCFRILAEIWSARGFPIESHDSRNLLYWGWGMLIGKSGSIHNLCIFLDLAGDAAPKLSNISPWACRMGHVGFVRYVLDNETLNVQHALGEAVDGGSRAVAQLLLQRGANVNGRSGKSSTLSMAVKRHHFRMVTFLVENGAKVDESCLPAAVGLVSFNGRNVEEVGHERLLTVLYILAVTDLPRRSNVNCSDESFAALREIKELVKKDARWIGLRDQVWDTLSRLQT